MVIDGDGPFLNGVEAKNGGLGWVKNGGGENGAVDAAVGNGEDPSEQIGKSQFAFAGASGQSGEGFFQAGEVELIAIFKDGDNQPFFGADGDPKVKVVLGNNFIAFDAGVEGGNGLEGMDGGLKEEAHEAKFYPVLRGESGLEFGTKGDEVGEIRLIKSGEDSGSLLSTDQAIGNFSAERGHFFARFAAGTVGGKGEGGGVGLCVHEGGRGGGGGVGLSGGGFGGGGKRIFPGRNGGRWGGAGGGGTGVEVADRLADFDLGPLWDDNFQGAIGFGKNFRSDFIGFNFKKGFAGSDTIAIFLFPASEDAGGD